MKKTPRQWLGYFALFFWFFCGMRIGSYLLALSMERYGLHLSVIQRNFFLRGITIDKGCALSFTAAWFAALFRERMKRNPPQLEGHQQTECGVFAMRRRHAI